MRHQEFAACALFFFSSRRRHTRYIGDWSSDVCSSDLDLSQSPVQCRHGVEYHAHDTDHRTTAGKWRDHHRGGMRAHFTIRSEERRVGKECRYWWATEQERRTTGTESAENI